MVAMLQSAGPPMINLGVMVGLSQAGGGCQSACALLLLVTYTCSMFTWVASIAAFLWLLS